MSRARTLAVVLLVLAASAGAPGAVAERPRPAAQRHAQARAKSKPPARPKRQAAPQAARGGTPAERRAARLGLGDMRAAGELLAGRTEPSWVRAAGPGSGLTGTLRLPVTKGHIVRGFGSGKGGYHQAVDIGGELGWKVYAAAAGIVGYADDGVSGYGNMVMLVHPGGQITTYAHNQKLLVLPGQRVARGALIALLGSTGRSKGPHVHFELLFNGQNCDPLPLFRPVARRRNGEQASPVLSVWTSANKRPKSIRCAARKHHPDYAGKARPPEDDDDDQDESSAP
jgi:murein DD-endopeptidase MepM/ murein hydrolase activator NlpD